MPQIHVTATDPRGSFLKNLVRKCVAEFLKPIWKLIPRSLYMDLSSSTLHLALTRKCNFDCVFCGYQYAANEDKVHMTDDTFQLVLKSIKAAKIRKVMLSPNFGEPTLAPHFFEKLKALREVGVEFIEMDTNGSLLHRLGIENILKDGPDLIKINLIGFEKELYDRDARRGSPNGYEQTRANVLDILRMNQQMGRPKKIKVEMRGDCGLEKLLAQPEMAEVRTLADELAYMNEVDDLGVITEKDLPEGYKVQKVKNPIKKRGCMMLYALTVHPKGEIQVCSSRNIFDDPGLHIGDIRNMTLVEAYAAIPKVLNKWESGQFPETCRKCSMYLDPAYGVIGLMRRIRKVRRTRSRGTYGAESGGCGSHQGGCESQPAPQMLYQIGSLVDSKTHKQISQTPQPEGVKASTLESST